MSHKYCSFSLALLLMQRNLQWHTVGFQKSGPLVSNYKLHLTHLCYSWRSYMHILCRTQALNNNDGWSTISTVGWVKCRVNFLTWSVNVISQYMGHYAHSSHSKKTTPPKQQNYTNAVRPHTTPQYYQRTTYTSITMCMIQYSSNNKALTCHL